MENADQLDQLVNWLSSFDPNLLKNEDDVETKFVLPLFQYLGYSDACRRGKYPINDYQPGKGKGGRKPEIDQIYFSESGETEQSSDTSLLLVEAKEPQEANLEEAIKQAKYYGNHLTPLFLVVTNGYRFVVLKRHPYRSEERVFDISTPGLLDRQVAAELYNQLHFDLVTQLKEQGVDILTHALYAELVDISHRYPDLQALLKKGDFEPSITQEKRHLTVIKPKVVITCDLPITFDEGSCSIEFSSIMLQGLTCHLSRLEILSDLLRGLGTDPHWNTRRFLQKTEQSIFEANLGQTTVLLSEREAYDLCDAVDIVGQRYKDIIIEAANNLETWDFWPITIDNEKGFLLLSVKQWLWDLMKKFSHEFHYDNGTTDWHIFGSNGIAIRVSHKEEPDHVIIWPMGRNFSLPEGDVDLLYVDSITYLYGLDDRYSSAKPFFEEIGPVGIWTAKYTKTWLVEQFIPQVLSYYMGSQTTLLNRDKGLLKWLPPRILAYQQQNKLRLTSEQLKAIMQDAIGDSSIKEVPLTEITEPKQFAHYIDQIQSVFHVYRVNIPAKILRPYYRAFSELAQCAEPTSIKGMDYIRAKLWGVQYKQRGRNALQRNLETYNDILAFLNQQAIRIYEVDYEHSDDLDLLSRVFATIVEDGVFHYNQKQLNAAKEALIPLWEYCRFETCFIQPIIFGYENSSAW